MPIQQKMTRKDCVKYPYLNATRPQEYNIQRIINMINKNDQGSNFGQSSSVQSNNNNNTDNNNNNKPSKFSLIVDEIKSLKMAVHDLQGQIDNLKLLVLNQQPQDDADMDEHFEMEELEEQGSSDLFELDF